MTIGTRMRLGVCLASTLIFSSIAGLASDDGESAKGLATIVIEGASETATCSIDGRVVKLPHIQGEARSLVVKAGRHVIEVHEGADVALREEVVLTPGETRALRVKGAEPE